MKIRKGYTLHEIGGETVAVPDDEAAGGMISLNKTAAALWKMLENETDPESLTAMLTARYDVDEEKARASADRFVRELQRNNLLE